MAAQTTSRASASEEEVHRRAETSKDREGFTHKAQSTPINVAASSSAKKMSRIDDLHLRHLRFMRYAMTKPRAKFARGSVIPRKTKTGQETIPARF
jgi:hypothetical protein